MGKLNQSKKGSFLISCVISLVSQASVAVFFKLLDQIFLVISKSDVGRA